MDRRREFINGEQLGLVAGEKHIFSTCTVERQRDGVQLCHLCNFRDVNSKGHMFASTHTHTSSGTAVIVCCLDAGQKHQGPKWSLCQLQGI